ncbi:MAG: hypothetical protein ABIO55_00740 [Ginsengibacter sp.]
MDVKTAISLIQSPATKSNAPTTWADLGCGSGLFTTALSTLLQAVAALKSSQQFL